MVSGCLYSGKDLKLEHIIQDPEDLEFELKCLTIYQKIIAYLLSIQKTTAEQDREELIKTDDINLKFMIIYRKE